MKQYSGLKNLFKYTWFLLLFAIILGGFLGYKFQQVYEVQMYGFEIVLALWSFSLMWAGLIVGYRVSKR